MSDTLDALPHVATIFPTDELLPALLEVSLTGFVLYTPRWSADGGEILDLEFVLLNTAAQRLLNLPAKPRETHLQFFPQSQDSGVFEFYKHVLLTGEAARHELRYEQDQQPQSFHIAARRVGEGLLVSLDSTAGYSYMLTEQQLQASQSREQAAQAEAEAQRNRLHSTFMQAPAMITIFEGPEHVFGLVNPLYQQLVGPRPLLGRPIREAMPELAGQPIFDLLDTVYRTGEAFHATEMKVQLDHANSGELGHNYYNFIYQPSRNAAGEVDGILVFAYEVTKQVLARQQVERSEQLQRQLNEKLADSNEELAAANEEMQAANEEIRVNNDELFRTQLALQSLNQELEAHVLHRTREANAARLDSERQRARLERFFMQAPAAICVLDGPDLVYELVNPGYQQLFPGRPLLGKPIGLAIPELTQQPIWDVLQHVYQTGETFEGREILILAARYEGGPREEIYFNFTYQPRFDAKGRIDGILVFAYEVTEQVLARHKVAQANDSLSQSNQQLTRINEDLDNFVYTASHDLKQPINNLAGVFEELKRTATFHDPDAALLVEMFEGALSQIHNTIASLTEVVRVERRTGQTITETVALQPLTEEIIRSIQTQATAAGATFELDFQALPVLQFARLNLQSILYNLLSNAIKYAHPGRPPRVRVSTSYSASGTPLLTVQDNGLGLDMLRYGADLFQMFRRFHDHVTGSGLGLYLVNRIVQQAGGTIEVDSTVDVGTTFWVHLPSSAGGH